VYQSSEALENRVHDRAQVALVELERVAEVLEELFLVLLAQALGHQPFVIWHRPAGRLRLVAVQAIAAQHLHDLSLFPVHDLHLHHPILANCGRPAICSQGERRMSGPTIVRARKEEYTEPNAFSNFIKKITAT